MANSVKRKIRLGTLFLFLLVLISSGVGIFHLMRLKNDANLILKNNYESLEYCHSMQRVLDSIAVDYATFTRSFDSVLRRQERNITEPGEQAATAVIRKYFEIYLKGDSSQATGHKINAAIQRVLQLNMAAIEVKNKKAGATADKALTYISFIAAIVFLVGFTFSYNFPSIVTGPINSLTEGIREISQKNYQFRIHLDRKDEFGQMADSFNIMAERLQYFENSNLNKIIFEKTRAEAVINSLKEASIGIDKNEVVLFANNQALQLLNLQAKDIIGIAVQEIIKRNDLLRFLVEEKSGLPFKIIIDNRENYFTKEVLEINQDNSSSKVIVLRNITSFKELDAAKTNFIATISHELKTPLASSDFSLKLLEDVRTGNLSPEQKELLENLRSDNQRMLRILSELLNMAQVETGKIQLEIANVKPAAIAENAIKNVFNSAREKNIEIRTNYAAALPMVMADTDKTTWVLNNFLSNAIKYSADDSSIILTIRQTGAYIAFSVADTGPGIPSVYLSKVFDRFFKVPGSKGMGSGLGLAISKEFIEAQGGKIWVSSIEGTGTEFWFSLPVKTAES